jgi:hypothetical protein
MDLTLREEYWIKFCMKLIAVISPDNYYRFHLIAFLFIYFSIKQCLNYFIQPHHVQYNMPITIGFFFVGTD